MQIRPKIKINLFYNINIGVITMENAIDKSISFVKWEEDGKVGYSIFLGGDSESGITVSGSTKEEVIENLKVYLFDSFDEILTE